MANQQGKKLNKGGRPRKFPEPSRPITVTLAERTLLLLESVDRDRARAITKVTDAIMPAHPESSRKVKLVEVVKGAALIVVGPSAHLKSIPWLKLVEISPANFILVLPSGVPVEKLEVAITDMIESIPDMTDYERELLMDLRKYLARLRRENKMRKSEIIFVDIKK
jgi:hypothetical protein